MITSFRDIQRLAGGFQAAKIFLTANDLGLFAAIGDRPRSAEELAGQLQVNARALGLLLNALTALGLLRREGELFGNHPIVHEHLGDLANYRGSIFRHLHHCWEAWNRLPEVVRTGHPDFIAEENALGDDDEWTRDFIRGMDDVTKELAPHVVPQLGLEQASVLLDVGGGPGTYAAAFQRAWPNLAEVMIFDLPDALSIGREHLQQWGLADRVSFHPGDFHSVPLPTGADAIWLSQVLHSQDDAGCQALIGKAFAALNPGGRLLIHEFLLNDDLVSPPMATIFAVHMLVMTEGGRTYSGAELGTWMRAAGFVDVEILKVSDDTAVVAARKP